MTKFLNISTDNTLGGNSPSDVLVASQKAIKEYVDSQGGGGGAVDSVNGKTGVVVLTATDVGALPDNTVIPTVNNPTITITQGGITKGSFTLNQASGDTIALDAGGGSGSGYHPDLFDVKWADHILNDAQWLRADTFSWQSGAVYQAAYANLSAAIVGKTLQSETVAGITVQFYLADDGHKICPDSEEDKILSIYNKTGNAWYYIIDTINQRFKLPRRHSQQIVRSVKNADGSWYRLYADGWVEQGGRVNGGTSQTATFPIAMADTEYTVAYGNISGTYEQVRTDTKTTTSITIKNANSGGTVSTDWQVSGLSAIDMSSFQDGKKYLYFYVGNFTQTALENTAGLNAELFNQKADLNLLNTASNIDFVVERQEPTAANNYTWYRKYKSGWVEQGGIYNPAFTGTKTFAYPVEMADTNYTLTTGTGCPDVNGMHGKDYITAKTTTGFSFTSVSLSGRFTVSLFNWQVSGIAAQ